MPHWHVPEAIRLVWSAGSLNYEVLDVTGVAGSHPHWAALFYDWVAENQGSWLESTLPISQVPASLDIKLLQLSSLATLHVKCFLSDRVQSKVTTRQTWCESCFKHWPSESATVTDTTRKRAIAKALQLEGHPDLAPVDLAYYQHFLVFLFENIAFWEVPPGNHKCRSHGATPFSTLNKQQIRTDFAVNLHCLLHTLWPWPLTLWPRTNVLAVMWWNSVLNLSEIDQCTPEL